ncbi:hypothetical protein [Clostridium sp. CF012]|uniref:hypothetical protein n=1 Tax=Clostridium sp. CF012 TaxID=2843319 RepID=UPI001C0ADDEC|nr:hypothetical protein [Clostridium sp. CF012]MBU3146862.1 hypothetical protein [Clostridium sp. CF012]
MDSIAMNKLKNNFDIYLEHEMPKDITITDLLNEKKCLSFLQKYMTELKALNLIVAALDLCQYLRHKKLNFLCGCPS